MKIQEIFTEESASSGYHITTNIKTNEMVTNIDTKIQNVKKFLIFERKNIEF